MRAWNMIEGLFKHHAGPGWDPSRQAGPEQHGFLPSHIGTEVKKGFLFAAGSVVTTSRCVALPVFVLLLTGGTMPARGEQHLAPEFCAFHKGYMLGETTETLLRGLVDEVSGLYDSEQTPQLVHLLADSASTRSLAWARSIEGAPAADRLTSHVLAATIILEVHGDKRAAEARRRVLNPKIDLWFTLASQVAGTTRGFSRAGSKPSASLLRYAAVFDGTLPENLTSELRDMIAKGLIGSNDGRRASEIDLESLLWAYIAQTGDGDMLKRLWNSGFNMNRVDVLFILSRVQSPSQAFHRACMDIVRQIHGGTVKQDMNKEPGLRASYMASEAARYLQRNFAQPEVMTFTMNIAEQPGGALGEYWDFVLWALHGYLAHCSCQDVVVEGLLDRKREQISEVLRQTAPELRFNPKATTPPRPTGER